MKAAIKTHVFSPLLALTLIAVFNAPAFAKTAVKKPVVEAAPVDAEFAAKEAAAADDTSLDAKLVVNPEPAQASAANTAAAPAATDSVISDLPKPTIESKAEVAAANAKLPENEIPVLTDTKATKKNTDSGFARIMISLGVLAALLGATTYALKKWSKKKGPQNSNTKIRILTQHALGPKKSLAIIQVAGESLLVGITDHNISMLKTLALIDDEVPEETPKNFDTALDEFDDYEEDAAPATRRAGTKRRETEEFAMRGIGEIRDTVSARIRKMTNS